WLVLLTLLLCFSGLWVAFWFFTCLYSSFYFIFVYRASRRGVVCLGGFVFFCLGVIPNIKKLKKTKPTSQK
ncbi:hypothetical protein LXA28_18140, partial [Erwinia amylovora]|uniref:hypothetical protein n=1 Tax=Erwinia amylovora TaxID=552 RepID=UPI0020BE470A